MSKFEKKHTEQHPEEHIEVSSASKSEKDIVAERTDRKALIRSSFQYGGPMAIDPSTIGVGFGAQWAHDDGSIERYLRLGFAFAEDKDGNHISNVVFTRGDKKGLKAFLLKAPQEILDEIDEVRREINEAPMKELEGQHDSLFPTLGLKHLNK
jgi:hypothetical protein